MPTLRPTVLFAVSAFFLVLSPSAYALRLPENAPGAAEKTDIEIVDAESLRKAYNIPASAGSITAMTADRKGKNVAFLLTTPQNTYSVYHNSQELLSGLPIPYAVLPGVFPGIFFFTDDGHLVHSINHTDLYIDDVKVSSDENTYSYYIGSDTVAYDGTYLYFPEQDKILSYHVDGHVWTTLYTVPNSGEVRYMRRIGKEMYYTVREGNDVYLYRNVSRLYDTPIDNETNFLVTKKGDVYTFFRTEDGYQLRMNNRPIFTGKGYSGFLFEDPRGAIWHVGYEVYQAKTSDPTFGTQRFNVFVYKNGKKTSQPGLANMEGAIAFQGNQQAFRASLPANPQTFYLIKNGKKTGQSFLFDAQRDNHGIAFTPNGKTYMRNYVSGGWQLFEDGKKVLADKLKDVWSVDTDGQRVRVYATIKAKKKG